MMRVFRFMSAAEAVAVILRLFDQLENHKDHASPADNTIAEAMRAAHTESKGFCFFPFVQSVSSWGVPLSSGPKNKGRYGKYWTKYGVAEAMWAFGFHCPISNPICLVLEVPEGSLKESTGMYNLAEDVFRFREEGVGYVGFGYTGRLDRVREYCSETYPEGYRVVGAVLNQFADTTFNGVPGYEEGVPSIEAWPFKGKGFEELSETAVRAKVCEMLRYLVAVYRQREDEWEDHHRYTLDRLEQRHALTEETEALLHKLES